MHLAAHGGHGRALGGSCPALVRAIGAWHPRVARTRGLPSPRTGAVTFVQRFGGLVNLNVHFHLVVPDGVFVDDAQGLRFELLPVPTNAEVLAILDRLLRRIARRIARLATPIASTRTRPGVLAQVQADAATTWRSSAELQVRRFGHHAHAATAEDALDAQLPSDDGSDVEHERTLQQAERCRCG